MNELEKELISVLLKHNVIDEHSLRNYRVRTRYKLLRDEGMSGKEARQKLADEECTSEKTIQYILYGKK